MLKSIYKWWQNLVLKDEKQRANLKAEKEKLMEEIKKQSTFEKEHGHELRELGKFDFNGHTYFLVDIKRDFVYRGYVPETEFLIHDPDCKKCKQ